MPVHQLIDRPLMEPMPEGWEATPALRDAVLAARQGTARARASIFERLVREHEGHRGFQPQSWPLTLEWGFTCDCGEEELDVRITVSQMRQLDAQDLYVLQERFNQVFASQVARDTRLQTTAQRRARCLLHTHLSRLQIKELNRLRFFTLVGKDGKTYRVTEGTCNNVQLMDGNKVQSILCVVFKDHARLPIYDLMLVQKFLLESNPEVFYKIANVSRVRRAPDRPPEAPPVHRVGDREPPLEDLIRENERRQRLRQLYARTQEARIFGSAVDLHISQTA